MSCETALLLHNTVQTQRYLFELHVTVTVPFAHFRQASLLNNRYRAAAGKLANNLHFLVISVDSLLTNIFIFSIDM